MELFKTFLTVAVAAGVGAWAGEKAYNAVSDKLPASADKAKPGIKLGMQAGAAVVTFGVVRSVL